MASVASLREHLVEELNDLLNAEQQLVDALPKMAERAASRELRAAFRGHLAETRQHVKRVTQALKQLGEKASGKTCGSGFSPCGTATTAGPPRRSCRPTRLVQ